VNASYNFNNGTWGSSNSGGGSSNSNAIKITASKTNPSTSQWVNIDLDTNTSYRGRAEFKLQYRSSSSSSWSTASSSDYTADNSFNRGYQFTASDRGYVTINSFIKFSRNGYYRLTVENDNGRTDYVDFDVNGGSSSNSNTIQISTNKENPSTNQRTNITLDTDTSYRGRAEFKLQYRSSSSSSWSTASSSDYTADNYFNRGYQFTASDRGYVTINSFIKFSRNGYYRLTVENDNGRTDYVDFNVNGSSSNSNTLRVSTNRSNPSTSQRANVTIETDSSYRDYVEFSLQYKDGSTWRTAPSSYYDVDNYFNRGYQFTASDRGYVTLNSFIKFTKNYEFRLYVTDKNRNEDYITFNVGGSSSNNNNNNKSDVSGFSVGELKKVTNVSKIWNTVVAELKRQTSKLRNDTYWQRLSDSFYDNMRDVINDRNNRTFSDWSDFMDAFNEWFRYTSRNS
jgi:hypothetical protein